MTENDTCDTFKSRNDSTITLLFCKGELKMTQQIHKNTYSSLHNGSGISARKGVSNKGILTIGSKTLE